MDVKPKTPAELFELLAPWCNEAQRKQLVEFRRSGQKIPGWFQMGATENLLLPIHLAQYEANVPGGVCEIGTHGGRSFIPMCLMRRKWDRVACVDMFEDSVYPSGTSPKPYRVAFDKNMQQYCGEVQDLMILQQDSLKLKPGQIFPCRLFHVDGHHTEEATRQDMLYGLSVLDPKGVMLVDDYEAVRSWPGVRKAVDALLAEGSTDFKLVHVAYNKAVLAREPIVAAVLKALEGQVSK